MNLVERVKKLLLTPSEEWSVIKGETHTVVDLYTKYVMILSAIPAVGWFLGFSVIGYRGMGLKVSAFFPTAWWLGGAFYILPALAVLAILGGLYSLWLLYSGLAPLRDVPEQNTVPYTVVVLLVAVVLMVVMAIVAGLAIPSTTRGF